MKPAKYKQLKPKLKPLPCPFCGKMPEIQPTNPELYGGAWGAVECVNKACPVNPRCYDGCKFADMRGPGAYQDSAIKRWNKRSPA